MEVIQVKERPILFSTPMVQGIQVGLKTQTRRNKGFGIINERPAYFELADITEEDGERFYWFKRSILGGYFKIKCPYGKIGDLLWVRETWGITKDKYHRICFKAGDQAGNVCPVEKWRPSIHMHKKAARIWLEITDIRVERLQDITKEDAKAEGIGRWVEKRMKSQPVHYQMYYQDTPEDPAFYSSCPVVSFFSLWQEINGPGSWDANPWVWVVEFKKINK